MLIEIFPENDLDTTEKCAVVVRDERWMIEQSSTKEFAHWIVALSKRGGVGVFGNFCLLMHEWGPCALERRNRKMVVNYVTRTF